MVDFIRNEVILANYGMKMSMDFMGLWFNFGWMLMCKLMVKVSYCVPKLREWTGL